MKKIVSALISLGCLLACASVMTAPKAADSAQRSSLVLTARADDIVTPGKNSASYKYDYADSSYYTTTITPVTLKKKEQDSKTGKDIMLDVTKWPMKIVNNQVIYNEKESHYCIYKVVVSHKDDNKTIVDMTEYRVGLADVCLDTTLKDTPYKDITIPDLQQSLFDSTVKNESITDSTKVTTIGPKAYSGTYLKAVDLTNIKYIGDSAFESCQYITDVTLPSTCLYVGKGVFKSSGLKALDIKCEMPAIPESLCESTNLNEIKFAYPKQILQIGKASFKNTPLTAPFFNDWTVNSTYENIRILDSAFENCTSIKSVNMPANLVRLDKSVFKGCTSLSSVVIGTNTHVIDAESFAKCTALDTIQFNSTLESLGGGVFSGCTSLKEVKKMPSTLEDWEAFDSNTGYGFGNNMFLGCTSLISCELPKSITKIPDGCFSGCTALTSVFNQDNIVGIGNSAFMNCNKLLEAKYTNATRIEAKAFAGCTALKELVYEKCTEIGASAFAGCSSATKFSVGTCTSVGDNALEGCSALTSIKLLSGDYGDYVFKNCSKAKTIEIQCNGMTQIPDGFCYGCSEMTALKGDFSDIPIIGPHAFEKCTVLPSVNFESLRIIGDNAFADCTALKSICKGAITAEDYGVKCFNNCPALAAEVSGNISTIDAGAFQNSGITKVNVNGMVAGTVVIGQAAFANCKNLASASVLSPDDAVYAVGASIFSNCPKLTTVVYGGPDITASMFKGCTTLKDVKISATTICDSAFEGCTALPMIKSIADSSKGIIAKEVGSAAFKDCAALTVQPADSTTTYTGTQQYNGCAALAKATTSVLTEGMFANCTKLSAITLSKDLTTIPKEAFANCTALTSMNLKSMLTIGESAFAGSGLKEVVIDNAQTLGYGAFSGCEGLSKINVSVETMGKNAFYSCIGLTDATVCTTSIGDAAFSNCTLLSNVKLQNSDSRVLNYIGSRAFSGCIALMDLVIPGSPEKIGTLAFGFTGIKANPDFLVVGETGSTVEAYATANNIPFCDVNAYDPSTREKRVTPGDVDGNGLVTIADAVRLQKYLLGSDKKSAFNAANADLNGDRKINAVDLTMLKRMILKG